MSKKVLLFLALSLPAFGLIGDLNSDCKVDIEDLQVFAESWLTDSGGDLNSDSSTNFLDYAIFASNWMTADADSVVPNKATTPYPANGSSANNTSTTLTWANISFCEFTKYDVWLGETGSMVRVVSDSYNASYTATLEAQHSYQWRVDTKNSVGTTTGDTWSFDTKVNVAPTATDGTLSVTTYIVGTSSLVATDSDAYPSSLAYYITAVPTQGYIRDNSGVVITASMLPKKMQSSKYCYETINSGSDHFHFKAYDGALYSDEKQITITSTANPKDCLSFSGLGTVTIPDNDLLDMVDGRGIVINFKTPNPNGGLLYKRDTGKPGYEIKMVGGHLVFNIYDASGIVGTLTSLEKYNTDKWCGVQLIYDSPNNMFWITTATEPASYDWYAAVETYEPTGYPGITVPVGTYANDCNLIVGKDITSFYKWEIDALRSYSSITGNVFYQIAVLQQRTIGGDSTLFAPIPVLRFKCNYDGTNNTITQIYDDISAGHAIGTINNSLYVRYYPFFMCPCNMKN